MKTRTMMMMAMVAMVFLFVTESVFAQGCCGVTNKNANTQDRKTAMMNCLMMKEMSKADIEKMIKSCPMMKGKTSEEQKKMMSSCPMMKYMMLDKKDKKPLTKEAMQKMMQNCPMMKNMSDADKKKMSATCPMMKCMSMMKGKGMMKHCHMMDNAGDKKLKEKTTLKQHKQQTLCPVMGGKISKKYYVDVNGKRIYVCCPGCISKIKQDPDKYIKKLEKDEITLEKVPKKNDSNKKETQKQNCH